MIQIILKVFSVFCSLGGPYIAPFIAPLSMLIMPPQLISCWAVLLVSIFWPIMSANPNVLNSSDGTNKDSTLAFRNSFFIYYAVMIVVTCSAMQMACKAREALPF